MQYTNISKIALLKIIEQLGLFFLTKKLNTHKVRCLLYHRFSGQKQPNFISNDVFYQQMLYIKNNYHVLASSDILKIQQTPVKQGVIITIDDGYKDFYDFAYPILKELNLPAIVFLTTNFVDSKCWLWFDQLEFLFKNTTVSKFVFPPFNENDFFTIRDYPFFLSQFKKIKTTTRVALMKILSGLLKVKIPTNPPSFYEPLTWEQIDEMTNHNITFGSHTCTHPILTQCSDDNIRLEISHSKSRLEEVLGKEVLFFSYPNGNYNNYTIGTVTNCGYQLAFSTDYGFFDLTSDMFTLKRIAIGERPLINFRQELCGLGNIKINIKNSFYNKRQH